jgi:Domain of unknown function (DUF4296)
MRSLSRYITLLIFLAVTLTTVSCTSRKGKAEHRDLIPENDLVNILKDVHMADGLLSMPGINYRFSYGDSLSSYIDVIESHGYTKPQMDRTMRFYFVKRPKKLVRIYDRVLGSLSEMESNLDKEIPNFRYNAQNTWTGSQNYTNPDPSGHELADIDIPLTYTESYYLKFTITVFPDDETYNPHLDMYLSHTDSTGSERKIYFSTPPYLKDGQPHTYNIHRTNKLPPPVRLKGWFVNHDESAPERYQNYTVTDIVLSRNRLD